jgi:septal ring factor EnvC (AmiA/AmiB activator)
MRRTKMNEKLKVFFKKFMTFLANNWIAILIIFALLGLSGITKSCADNKLRNANARIAELEKANKDLEAQLAQSAESQDLLDIQLKELLAVVESLKKDKESLEKDKAKIAKKYKDLQDKFGQLSQEQQDQLLIELMEKYNIQAEIRDNMLIITMEDRGRLYTFMIDIDKVKEDLENTNELLLNCRATVTAKDEIISNRNATIVLKDKDITTLKTVLNNKDEIIRKLNNKVLWTKVKFFGSRAIPALLVGLVVGFLVGK